MATFVTFWTLLLGCLLSAERRARVAAKSAGEWLLDVSGLLVQGFVIPAVQILVLYELYRRVAPSMQGVLRMPGWCAFALNFVVIDYLYYWNHRLLHSRLGWPVHAVHHSMTDMDVLGTSRNTLWSSFLIVYVWLNSAAIFLLADPAAYVAAASLTACLDLWRHSPFQPPAAASRVLGVVLILPGDHGGHHAEDGQRANYGANLNLWDRLHGTWSPRREIPSALGVPVELPLWRRLLWPFSVSA